VELDGGETLSRQTGLAVADPLEHLAETRKKGSQGRKEETAADSSSTSVNIEAAGGSRRAKSFKKYASTKYKLKQLVRGVIRSGFGILFGYFLAKLGFFGLLYPFGPAYAGVWSGSPLPVGFLFILSTLIGLGTEFSGTFFWARLGTFLFLFYLGKVMSRKFTPASYGLLALFLCGLIGFWRILGFTDKPFLLLHLEVALAVGFYFLLKPGLLRLFFRQKGFPVQKVRYSLGLLAVVTYLTFAPVANLLAGGFVNFSLVFALSIILLLTMYCGTGAGSVMTAAFTLGAVVGRIFAPWEVMLMTGTGLLGGLVEEIKVRHCGGKIGYILGFVGNLFLVYVIWPESRLPATVCSSLLALGVTALVPRTASVKFCQAVLEIEEFGLFGKKAENVRKSLFLRLHGISEFFLEISRIFREEPRQPEEKTAVGSLMEEITRECCVECRSFPECWRESFYSTYKEVFDLITLADLQGGARKDQLQGRLGEKCSRREQLLSVVNHKTERYKVEFLWRRKFEEAKGFLSTQLTGVSRLISRLIQQINMDLGDQIGVEEELFTDLRRMGFSVSEVSVTCLSRNNIEIEVTKKSCAAKEECRLLVAPVVAQLLTGGFSVKNRQCRFGEGGDCRFTLWKSPCFSVRSMAGAIPKTGNELCGDSHRLIVSNDGYTAAILSDGMGAGEEAAKLSKMTISLLERLMATGLDKKVSLQLVNSLLLLRSTDENFATLDLFVLDHYTGEGEFIKIGSAPTYLKRGKDIDVIRSTSLPVGILHEVEPECFRYSLQDGDYIVLITDGFLGFNKDKEGDWILKALKKADNIGPEALCGYLLELACMEAGSTIEDDMSIMVLQIINEDNSTKPRNSFI